MKKNPHQSSPLTINVFNGAAPLVSNADVQAVIPILQKQLDQHLAPAWGVTAKLNFVTKANPALPTLNILESSSEIHIHQGSGGITLGFHDMTMHDVPFGFVFVKDTTIAGFDWPSTASHEIMELVVDPYAGEWAEAKFQGQLAYFAYETCDPVQNDVYILDGVKVSNFVLPSWFISPDRGSAKKWDFLGNLTGPLQVDSGGDAMLFFQVGRPLSLQGQISSSHSSSLVPLPTPAHKAADKAIADIKWNDKAHIPGSRWFKRWKRMT